ncbi:MAG: hypothetical protein ACOZCO_06165 [Bacteroidota bacterium]
MKKIFFLLFCALLANPLMNDADAQCKSYAKRQCRPVLSPYVHDGKVNNAVLVPGDKAELLLTFFSGINYRLMVCAMPVLGEVSYKILDSDRNVIFESKKNPDKKYFDFKVGSTQQLIVEIVVPESKKGADIVPEGCVAVLIGTKQEEK